MQKGSSVAASDINARSFAFEAFHRKNLKGRAPKRALTVLEPVGICWHLLSIVGLISAFGGVMVFADAAFKEASAAERFRRGFWISGRGFACSIPTLASKLNSLVLLGETKVGKATVSKLASVRIIHRYLPELAETLVKMDGAWLFAERLLYVDWMEERALSQ